MNILVSTKRTKMDGCYRAHFLSDFKLCQNTFTPGALPWSALQKLTALPRPISTWMPLLFREEMQIVRKVRWRKKEGEERGIGPKKGCLGLPSWNAVAPPDVVACLWHKINRRECFCFRSTSRKWNRTYNEVCWYVIEKLKTAFKLCIVSQQCKW